MKPINENLLDYFDIHGTAMETLGIKVTRCDAEMVIAEMEVGPGHYQPFGLLHGGLSLVLAETAASVGAHLYLDLAKQYAVGLEINANHLKGVRGGTIRAEARPLHLGRQTQVWDIRICNEAGELTAISRCTVAIRDHQPAFGLIPDLGPEGSITS